MKKIVTLFVCVCLLLTGCSKTPELLDPVGAIPNSAVAELGEVYCVEYYNSAVVQDVKEIKTASDSIVKSIDVTLGEEVKAGQTLISLDGGAMSSASASIDTMISEFQKEADYTNRLLEADIKIFEGELKVAQATGDSKKISRAQENLTDAQTELNVGKVEQAKQLANLEAQRLAGGATDGAIVAPCDGTVCYMNVGAIGSTLKANTMIIGIAQKDSLLLKGELISQNLQNEAKELYALIGGKRYNITLRDYSPAEESFLVSNNYPLYSHFLIDADENVKVGMSAAIVRVWNYEENVLRIPDNALYLDDSGYYVYVIKGEEKERRDVTVGVISDVAVEITAGLKEGEEVYVK